jgi:hypothetical protein
VGFENDLLEGIALLLAAKGVAAWDATGDYPAATTGIYVDVVPANDDNLLTLSDYPVSDDPTLSESVVGVQVRTRKAGGDPRPVKDLDGAAFDVLHGFAGDLPNGVHVDSCYRRSGASLGQDGNNRWGRTSNYYVTAHRPSTNRT